jgi:bacterioferritin-associated ferredoxin
MIICHCRRVCDRTIRAAIEAGAVTEEDVSDACGAGSGCGGCLPAVTEILEERAVSRRRLTVVESAA